MCLFLDNTADYCIYMCIYNYLCIYKYYDIENIHVINIDNASKYMSDKTDKTPSPLLLTPSPFRTC